MKLQHTTLARNIPGIMRDGIDPKRSKGRLAAVWLHVPSRKDWAIVHTLTRHGGRVSDVVVLDVTVPRSWLRRSAWRGKYYCTRVIPSDRISCIHTLGGAKEHLD